MLESVKSSVCPVPRWLYHFLMEGLDNFLTVDFDDSAAAWGFGCEGQHGELARGLSLTMGSQEMFKVPSHSIVCMNKHASSTFKKLLVVQQSASSPCNSGS